MSEKDKAPSFVEGYDQGLTDGYFKALNDVAAAIAGLKDKTDGVSTDMQLPDYMQEPDMTFAGEF